MNFENVWCISDSTRIGPQGKGGLSVAEQMRDTGWPAVFFFFPFITRGWSDVGQAT